MMSVVCQSDKFLPSLLYFFYFILGLANNLY